MKKILIMFMLGASIVGCNDDFLERAPLDQISDETFWKSQKDLELYCNSLYSTFIQGHTTGWADGRHAPYGYPGSPYLHGDLHSDNAMSNDQNMIKLLNNLLVEPVSSGSEGWSWGVVRKINFFFDNYKRGNFPENEVAPYVGEMYLFKAWEYYNKTKIFGDVPWISKTLNTDSEELYAPRNSRKDVMDSVLVCLDKAISLLPERKNAKVMRLNKDVALHLKARICLYEGTFRKYHTELGLDGTNFLREAVKSSESLMTKGYDLYSTGDVNNDYHNLFVQYDYSTNPEIILWRKYSYDFLGHAALRYWSYNDRGKLGATKSLIDEYLCKDGLPISKSPYYKGDASIFDELTDRDPRMRQTICYPGEYVLNLDNDFPANYNSQQAGSNMPDIPGTIPYRFACPTGYRVIKYWIHDVDEMNRVTKGYIPCPEFRFAETLLIYAEAKAELGEVDQSIIDRTINKIRDRAGMPHLDINNIPDDPYFDTEYSENVGYIPSPLIREIRRERRVEMANENLRWDDLCRWKAGGLVSSYKATLGMKFRQSDYPNVVVGRDIYLDENGYILPYKVTLPKGRKFDENRDYYYPIPLEDLVLNKNLKQNPGWKTSD